ncbi:Long-chain-fatty-acid--CoA ligase FadD15 [subsurface metagenome]
MYYAENLKSILNNMQEVHPDGTTVVPRVLEKIVKGVLYQASESFFVKKWVVRWCVNFGFKYELFSKEGKYNRFRHFLTDIFLYRSIRSLLGGKLKYVGLGGSPIPDSIERFFWAAGIPVFQGYGLTECSPLVALNYWKKKNIKIGTVGPLIKKVKVKIAGDGEILVKGPNVMRGYYKNNELTNKAIVNGYLHTGDLGEFVDAKFLKITGRKKEMFKTSYGKYIVPQAIENRFLDCPSIDHIMIIGEGKHYAAAIISPNFDFFRKKTFRNFEGSDEKLIHKSIIDKTIHKEIAKVNRHLGKTEQIKKFLLVFDLWSPATGEISSTQKLRRNSIMSKYSVKIHNMYKEDS